MIIIQKYLFKHLFKYDYHLKYLFKHDYHQYIFKYD